MKTLLKCAEIVIALTRSISSPYNSDRERCTHLSYKLYIYIYMYILYLQAIAREYSA